MYKLWAGFCGLGGFGGSHLALVTWDSESLREAATAYTRNVMHNSQHSAKKESKLIQRSSHSDTFLLASGKKGF